MEDLRQDKEWTVESGSFRYRDVWMSGRGVIRWYAEGRLEVDLLLDRGTARPPPFSEWLHGLVPINMHSSLRLELTDTRRVLVPALALANRLDLEAHGRLTVQPSRAIFVNRWHDPLALDRRFVEGEYVFPEPPILPQSVTSNVFINDKKIEMSGSMTALEVKTRYASVRCRMKEKPYLTMTVALDEKRYAKEHERLVARAVQCAFSLLTGQEVWLVQSIVERGGRAYQQVAVKPTTVVLSFLKMFPGLHVVPANLFWAIAQRLMTPSKEQWIIEGIRAHMMAADQQPMWYGKKLMVGTLLEGVLRSYYDKPYSTTGRAWQVEQGLKEFQERLFGSAWKSVKNDVLRSFGRIRHSTAHPDWIPSFAERNDPATAQEMTDVQLLAWFYGQTVLALAGVGGLKPEVPAF